jgi:putative membrane protein
MNKELVLREYLALERTRMANETTFLAYSRTGLYFLVAGVTFNELLQSTFWKITSIPLMLTGILIMTLGFLRFIRTKKKIEASKRNIGESSEAFIKAVRGSVNE